MPTWLPLETFQVKAEQGLPEATVATAPPHKEADEVILCTRI